MIRILRVHFDHVGSNEFEVEYLSRNPQIVIFYLYEHLYGSKF